MRGKVEDIKLSNLSSEQAHDLLPEGLILLGYRGSIAHGLYQPKTDPNSIDDKDIMGVYVAPIEHYLGFGRSDVKEKFIGEWDAVSYEVRKFIGLLLKCNPNVLSLLWLPEQHVIFQSDLGRLLCENRNLFVSRAAYHSFTGYAHGQFKRMTHFNKEIQDQMAQLEQAISDEGIDLDKLNATQEQRDKIGPTIKVYEQLKAKYFAGGYMGRKRKELVMKFGYDCYDAETTEFLTLRGWQFYDEIKGEDCIGTVNIQSGDIEYQRPLSRTDRIHSGTMFVIEPYSSRAMVTPEHMLLVSPAHRSSKNNFSIKYQDDQSEWGLRSVMKLIEGYRSVFHIRRAPSLRHIDYEPVDDNYLRLIGLYISEGCAQFRCSKLGKKLKAIRFTQKYMGAFFRLAEEIESVFPIRRYDYGKETIWILHGEVATSIYSDCGDVKEKRLPDWTLKLSARQVEVLWDALMAGDGTRKDANDCYYTSVKGLADSIHAMLISAGIPSSVYGPYDFVSGYGSCGMYHIVRSSTSDAFHPLYMGRILKQGEIPSARRGYPVKEITVEDRRVVCFEVENGTLITRNRGKVAIHGNCKNAAHLIRLLKMGIEFLTDGILYVERPDAQQLLQIKRGEWTLDQVKSESERLFKLAEEAYMRSRLPVQPDNARAEMLCQAIIRNYHGLRSE